MGKSQGTLRKRRFGRSGGGGGGGGEQETGKDVKGKKPYTAPRRALQQSGLGAGAPTLGGGGINRAGSTRGAPRGGAGLWAGPTAAPRGPAPRTNLSPGHWRASGAGPRDTRLSPPAPAPPPGRPSFRLLQEPQSAGKGNTRGCHTARGRWKGCPHCRPARPPGDVNRVGPRGPAPRPRALALGPPALGVPLLRDAGKGPPFADVPRHKGPQSEPPRPPSSPQPPQHVPPPWFCPLLALSLSLHLQRDGRAGGTVPGEVDSIRYRLLPSAYLPLT